jgi:hypothetical protein
LNHGFIFIFLLFVVLLIIDGHYPQVIVKNDVLEIPSKHIKKRWTKEARDVLPVEYLMYQKDQGPPKSATYRHSKLYLKALELVQLGDANVEAYQIAMDKMTELRKSLEKVSSVRDGMGLDDKLALPGCNADGSAAVLAVCPADSGGSCSRGSGTFSAPDKKRPGGRKGGRPTTSRDRPPYEMPVKRSRFCSICRQQGHKSTTCPQRGDVPKTPRKSPRCSACGLPGHRRSTCVKRLF